MRHRWICVLFTVFMVYSVFSISRGADKFYYGTYSPNDTSADFHGIKDSLKFNIAYGSHVNDTTIQLWIDDTLRAIVSNLDNNSPYTWSAKSHYTLWEAEGYLGSYYHFTYNGGQPVSDGSASGGHAMKFSGPYTGRLIQWGPTYYQEAKYEGGLPIPYTADFNLKLLSTHYTPSAPVCSIMVVDAVTHSILKDTTLYKSDFIGGNYKTILLAGYNVPANNRIEFQIYLFGTSDTVDFYVDYVRVYDDYGRQLIIAKEHDIDITNYVSQSWVKRTLGNGDTVVYRWYLCDEPNYVDLFEPGRYVDSLIHTKSTERVGFQAFNQPGTILEGEYLLRQNPKEYSVDIYPTRWYGPDSSGENFQLGMDTLMMRLGDAKQAATTSGKDLWVTVQAHYYGFKTTRPDTCCYLREK